MHEKGGRRESRVKTKDKGEKMLLAEQRPPKDHRFTVTTLDQVGCIKDQALSTISYISEM